MSEANATNATEANEVSEQVSTPEPKMVPLKELIELRNKFKETKSQLEQFQMAEQEKAQKDLSESEKWKKKYDEVFQINQANEIKSKKHKAFLDAKSKLGEGYTIENEDKVYSAIEKLQYNEESYLDDISNLLEIAKKPKKQAAQVFNMGASQVATKDASEYTGVELRQIQESDPERFKQILSERKNKK